MWNHDNFANILLAWMRKVFQLIVFYLKCNLMIKFGMIRIIFDKLSLLNLCFQFLSFISSFLLHVILEFLFFCLVEFLRSILGEKNH